MMSANRKAVGALQFFRPLREWKHSEVVDWVVREISPGKRGFIPGDTPPILARLGMDTAPVRLPQSQRETIIWCFGVGEYAACIYTLDWATIC